MTVSRPRPDQIPDRLKEPAMDAGHPPEPQIGAALWAAMQPRRVDVHLVGCDETTTVSIEVSPAELQLLKRLAAVTRAASQYDCMPKMAVGDAELAAIRGYKIKGDKTLWP